MSFWSKINTVVRDLEIFKNACKTHGVRYEEAAGEFRGYKVKAQLHDTQTGGPSYNRTGYLVEADGAYKLLVDNDVSYSSLSNRLGKNGGIMMRDYTQWTIEKSIQSQGGMVIDRVENADGSVILKMAVNA